MKAIRAARPVSLLLLAGLLASLSACSGRREPAPAPAPRASPQPRPPAPPPQPRAIDWRDMPITPGSWQWRMEGSRSVARFANGALVLSCNRDAGSVTLMRPGSGQAGAAFTIVTSTANRTLSGEAIAGPPAMIALVLPARDALLDAMAFSRGRFAVETSGLPTLYVPSWPEVSRVIEDCR